MQLDLVIDTDSEGEIPPEDFFHDAQPQPCVQGPPLEQSGVFSFLSSAPAWDLNHLLSQASMNKNSENVNLSAEDITRLKRQCSSAPAVMTRLELEELQKEISKAPPDVSPRDGIMSNDLLRIKTVSPVHDDQASPQALAGRVAPIDPHQQNGLGQTQPSQQQQHLPHHRHTTGSAAAAQGPHFIQVTVSHHHSHHSYGSLQHFSEPQQQARFNPDFSEVPHPTRNGPGPPDNSAEQQRVQPDDSFAMNLKRPSEAVTNTRTSPTGIGTEQDGEPDDKPRMTVTMTAPCDHNQWERISKKKNSISLRCRKCKACWKTKLEFFQKCPDFYSGSCPRGDGCPHPHIHSKAAEKHQLLKQNQEPEVPDTVDIPT